ncbi:hypothetical protein QTO17_02665, partial [Vibrio owensii]
PAAEEISNKTDLLVSYNENSAKGGRKNSVVSITFKWTEKNEPKEDYGVDIEDYVDLSKPPVKEEHEEDVFVEMGLVYLDTFNADSTAPSMEWAMDFMMCYQRVRGEVPTDLLKQSLLNRVTLHS